MGLDGCVTNNIAASSLLPRLHGVSQLRSVPNVYIGATVVGVKVPDVYLYCIARLTIGLVRAWWLEEQKKTCDLLFPAYRGVAF